MNMSSMTGLSISTIKMVAGEPKLNTSAHLDVQ